MKQWRDDIKRFFATYFMINYETGMLEWIDGGEVKTCLLYTSRCV